MTRPINRKWACAALLALTCTPLSLADETKITRAREILDLFLSGEYAKFCATGDENVRSKFSPAQARQTMAGIEFQIGKFKRVESAKHSTPGGLDSIAFACTFEKGTCTLQVVLDAKDRMSGFWLPSIKPSAKYAPPDYVDKAAFREEKITVDAGSFPLPGTISIPNGDGPHPGVLLVHGSGAHDQDESIIGNKPFRDLAWGLASRGVAVLRYEKRTHKYHPADMKPEEITFEWETIDDAVAAAALLREHSAIDKKRVFIAGHSLGAMAAPFIAKREPKLAGIILLAGAARSLLDLIVEQTAYIAASDGNLTDEERKQIDLIQQAVADIKVGNMKEGGNAAGLPGPYLARMDKLDPVGAARKLSIPMLIMQGARDYQVTTTDFELWQRGLKDRKNVTFKLYDDLNHLFMTGSGKSTPAEYQQVGHVDAQVVRDIAEWIAATAKND